MLVAGTELNRTAFEGVGRVQKHVGSAKKSPRLLRLWESGISHRKPDCFSCVRNVFAPSFFTKDQVLSSFAAIPIDRACLVLAVH
jgi:hypothetical protein